ncbi:MAG: hypothetical protein CMG08_05385 [Candidatus Marinimicrobia bacterium]|nr:hypothetical protein [Candidatus Neomarinimicrobiota bacterium]
MFNNISEKIFFVAIASIFLTMCAPPEISSEEIAAAERAKRDSIKQVRCPRLMSTAAEFYKNRDWESTVRVYGELTDIGCDEEDPSEVYLYYAIAYEYLGKYDSSEYVILKGLSYLPDDISLRKRLAFAYEKQNKIEMQMNELDRLSFLSPQDLKIKTDLAKLYEDQGLFDDQISVLRDLLDIDPKNEGAQSDLAKAYEKSGKDPLDVYRSRFENNPSNVSYGLDYADKLLAAERTRDAVNILKEVVDLDPSSKVILRKLAQAYDSSNRLDDAAKTYEKLFRLDPRDFRVAVKISEVYLEDQNFKSSFDWADKAVTLSGEGEAYAAKGNLYYKAFQACRSGEISTNDRIIASLAYRQFNEAEKRNFTRYDRSKSWLKDNEVLFEKAQWFMMEDDVKNRGYIKASSSCYGWVSERLNKDKNW